MNRREFIKGLVTTAIGAAIAPKQVVSHLGREHIAMFADLSKRGAPDESVHVTCFDDVVLVDGWMDCIRLGDASHVTMGNLVMSVHLDLDKVREYVRVIDDTGGKWCIIGDFEGLKGPNGEMIL